MPYDEQNLRIILEHVRSQQVYFGIRLDNLCTIIYVSFFCPIVVTFVSRLRLVSFNVALISGNTYMTDKNIRLSISCLLQRYFQQIETASIQRLALLSPDQHQLTFINDDTKIG